jgi:colicin import membrane protein
MRTAYTISAIGHGAVLVWSIWSLAAKPLPATPSEALPVDIVSVSELTQITAGSKSAPKADTPKPLVEKVAEPKPVEDPSAKLDKKEVKAVREPPPSPEAKPVEAKPEKKQTETKPDQIAEALAKDEAKKPEQKKAEAKPPTPPKKPVTPAPKFDPKTIQETLLNKQNATRLAAAGDTINNTASLGLPNAGAAQMSLSELDALRQRLLGLWRPPTFTDPQEVRVTVRLQLKRDRTLAGPPQIMNSGTGARWLAAKDGAIRALYAGQPFDMLKPEHYDQWNDIEIDFYPRDMDGRY